jgi:hypothetical protein
MAATVYATPLVWRIVLASLLWSKKVQRLFNDWREIRSTTTTNEETTLGSRDERPSLTRRRTRGVRQNAAKRGRVALGRGRRVRN